MLRTEFSTAIEGLGFSLGASTYSVWDAAGERYCKALMVKNTAGHPLLSIAEDCAGWLKLGHMAYHLPEEKRVELLRIGTEYANTPTEGRESESLSKMDEGQAMWAALKMVLDLFDVAAPGRAFKTDEIRKLMADTENRAHELLAQEVEAE